MEGTRAVSGALYVVGTPIGNLGDLTRRAEATLSTVDVVAAEDTRRTRALLSHLGIVKKPLVTLDANASDAAVDALVGRLVAGESVGLVTDAGTPGVSDPGSKLVRRAAARGVPVTIVPGPSAVTAAVAVSGLVEGPFLFLGFLPRKGQKRKATVARIRTSPDAVILFEAPGRVHETLAELAEAMPERRACVARELTKVHEEALRGTLADLARSAITDRGEFTIVVEGGGEVDEVEAPDIAALVKERLDAGDSPRTVATDVAALTGQPRREIYRAVLALVRARDGA